MTTQLSSLRVAADLQPAGYVQGMAAKIAADKAGTASSKEIGAAVTTTQTKVNAAGDIWQRLSRQYVTGAGEAQRFEGALRSLQRGLDTGNLTLGQTDQVLEGMYRKYGMVADAEKLAAEGQRDLATVVATVNARVSEGAVALRAQTEEWQRMAIAAKASVAADAYQSSINTTLGVRDPSLTAGSARASAAVFEEAAQEAELLERQVSALRGQINPLGAAQDRLNIEMAEYSVLASKAVITTEELAQAQALAQQRFNATATSLGKGKPNSFNTANIAAQFQDIGVTSAMGMSPMQIALQQGTQLSAVFEQLKGQGKSVGASLAAAFGSILSPISLVTIGAVAAGAALIQWLGPVVFKSESATEALKRHNDTLRLIVTGYKGAGEAVGEYLDKANQAPRGVVQVQLTAQLKEARTEAETFLVKIDNIRQSIQSSRFESTAQRQLAGFIQDFQKGEISASEFATAMETMALNPQVDGQAKDLAKTLESGALAAASLNDLLIALSFAAADTGHNQGLQVILDSQLAAEKSAEAQRIELDAINAKSPAQLAEIARRRKSIEVRDEEISDALRQQKIEEAGALAYAQAARTITQAEQSKLRAANDNLASSKLDLELIGKSIGEAERLRFVRQQLSTAEAEAAQNGVSVSKSYIDAINKIGDAYGNLQQKIAETKLTQDLQFQRGLIGLSPVEQDVANQLRAIYGDDTNSAQALFLAQQIRINTSLRDLYDTGRSVTEGFLADFKSELRQTGDLWEALGSAGANALDKIADKALGMAADGIWDIIFGALKTGITGGSMPGFDFLGNLLPSTGGLFATGGYTGNSPANQPAGVVHGQEYVFSASATSRIGAGNLDRLHQSARGYASGGFVNPVGANANWPNMSDGGAGSLVFSPVYNINGTGLTMAQLQQVLAQNNSAMLKQLPTVMRDAHRRAA